VPTKFRVQTYDDMACLVAIHLSSHWLGATLRSKMHHAPDDSEVDKIDRFSRHGIYIGSAAFSLSAHGSAV